MHVYVDESGSFIPGQNKVAGLFGLVIPSSQREAVFRDFSRLLKGFGFSGVEAKGSRLTEAQIAGVVALARRHELILETALVDLADHSDSVVLSCRDGQAAGFIVNVDEDTPATGISELMGLRQAVSSLSPQLYLQACLVLFLFRRVFEHATTYYSQRDPRELAELQWVVDRKDNDKTPFERYWSTAIRPLLSMQSKESPIGLVPFGDYSYMDRFHVMVDGVQKLDPSEIFGDNLSFVKSSADLGVQLVDVLGSAVTRAFNGTLAEEGWRDIGGLIIARQPQSVNFLEMRLQRGEHTGKRQSVRGLVVDKMRIGNRPMLTLENTERVDRILREGGG